MKAIDRDAARAFYDHRYFKRSNTINWTSRVGGVASVSTLSLFGNQIAELYSYQTGILDIYITTAGWETVTTKARLNAILRPLSSSVHTSRGELILETADNSFLWDGSRFNIYRGPIFEINI